MRIRELADIFKYQDIYIVGTGPTINLFEESFFEDKICISLNDAYKIYPTIGPVALMHHHLYSREGNNDDSDIHKNFYGIKYPVVKGSGISKTEFVDWESPYLYFYDWTHDINHLESIDKSTDYLYYTPDGCSLHGALQLAWLMGAKNIFTIGCDSRIMGGKHYANYDKNNFRDAEVLKRGAERNYDNYVYGTLVLRNFLKSKKVNLFNLSPIVGYNLIDFQYDFILKEEPSGSLVKIVYGKDNA